MDIFFTRWLILGFTYGEAACAAQEAVSWQTTVVGDPLYRPFGQDAGKLHDQLLVRHSPLLEWLDLRWVDLNLAAGKSPETFISFLEKEAPARQSAILFEKLASLQQAAGNQELAIASLRQALAHNPTPQTAVRLNLALGDLLQSAGHDADALKVYADFQKNTPDYPDALAVWTKMQALAKKLGKKSDAARYAAQAQKLAPRPNLEDVASSALRTTRRDVPTFLTNAFPILRYARPLG